jgi:hypothetical protein
MPYERMVRLKLFRFTCPVENDGFDSNQTAIASSDAVTKLLMELPSTTTKGVLPSSPIACTQPVGAALKVVMVLSRICRPDTGLVALATEIA